MTHGVDDYTYLSCPSKVNGISLDNSLCHPISSYPDTDLTLRYSAITMPGTLQTEEIS
jgi:hypothetical protein